MRPLFVGLLLLSPAVASAQVIPIRTAPIAVGDQFLLVPSRTAAMGGVTIAVADPLADPFTNPALGGDVPVEGRAFIAPVFSSVTQNVGHARSLPLGAQFGRGDGRWFGSLVMAFQQLRSAGPTGGGCCFPLGASRLSSGTATNLYANGTLGRHVGGDHDLNVGLGIFIANLSAVDGVDLLYPRSLDIAQSGHLTELRVGAAGETGAGNRFQVIGLHNRLDMTHDVEYALSAGGSVVRTGFDRTRTWGLHGEYTIAAHDGLRVGATATGNWKSHPSIPDYELAGIPRDPGNSWAYALGLGIARERGPATIGADVVLQPVWSHTWAEAAGPVERADGTMIPAGGRTVDNRFQFLNAILRVGVERRLEPVTLAAGLNLYSVNYTLRQNDRVSDTRRTQREDWTEWSPTLGLTVSFPEFTMRYVGAVRTGTGRPGVARTGTRLGQPQSGGTLSGGGVDFLPAPGGALTLFDAVVLTHQLVITMPLGG